MRRYLKHVCLCIVLILAGIVLFQRAATKPFWFDEIITLRIAQCPLGPQMWNAITSGIDFTPPAIHVATRLSELTFGRGPIFSRLPSIVSGLFVLFFAFQVSARAGGTAAGFWSLFLLCFSQVFVYFTEARGYALVMAGTMLAWFSWQGLIANTGRRWLGLFGISAGLSLALVSHMWSLVIPPCFVASAMARRLRGKAIDVSAVAAMIAPGILVLTYEPIVASARRLRFGGGMYFGTTLAQAYRTSLEHLPLLLIACVVVFAIDLLLPHREGSQPYSRPANKFLLGDGVLAACLVCAPAGIYVAAKLMHTAFMSRYALVAVLGSAFLLSQLLAFLGARSRVGPYTLPLILGVGLFVYAIHSVLAGWRVRNPLGPELTWLAQSRSNTEPIVLSSGLEFLQADYYAPAALASRLAYVADRDLAKQFVGTDGMDSTFVLGGKYLMLRGRVVSYAELRRNYRNFWLVSDSTFVLNWLSDKLRADGADIRALDVPFTRISHVTIPAATPDR